MKAPKIILLLAVLMATIPACGQGRKYLPMFAAGLRVGSNLSDIRLTDNVYDIYDHSMKPCVISGAYFQYRPIAGISFRPEVTYKSRGGVLTCNDVHYNLLANSLNFRLCMQLDFYTSRSYSSFYIMAAPSVNNAFGGHVNYSSNNTGEIRMKLSFSSIGETDFELFFGAGFEYPIWAGSSMWLLSAEAGYAFSLTDNFTAGEHNGTVTTLNHADLSHPASGSRLFRGFEVAVRMGMPFGKKLKIRR